MSGQSDLEQLQELVRQLSPHNAELMNRLERARLTLEFMLAGIRRPRSREEILQESLTMRDSRIAPISRHADFLTVTQDICARAEGDGNANPLGN